MLHIIHELFPSLSSVWKVPSPPLETSGGWCGSMWQWHIHGIIMLTSAWQSYMYIVHENVSSRNSSWLTGISHAVRKDSQLYLKSAKNIWHHRQKAELLQGHSSRFDQYGNGRTNNYGRKINFSPLSVGELHHHLHYSDFGCKYPTRPYAYHTMIYSTHSFLSDEPLREKFKRRSQGGVTFARTAQRYI